MLIDVLEVFIIMLSIFAVMILVCLLYEIVKDMIEHFNDQSKLKESRYDIRKR